MSSRAPSSHLATAVRQSGPFPGCAGIARCWHPLPRCLRPQEAQAIPWAFAEYRPNSLSSAAPPGSLAARALPRVPHPAKRARRSPIPASARRQAGVAHRVWRMSTRPAHRRRVHRSPRSLAPTEIRREARAELLCSRADEQRCQPDSASIPPERSLRARRRSTRRSARTICARLRLDDSAPPPKRSGTLPAEHFSVQAPQPVPSRRALRRPASRCRGRA